MVSHCGHGYAHTPISDNVLSIYGLSDPSIVDYCLALAKSAKSETKLLASLRSAADLPDTDAALAFANELYRRVPRDSAASASFAKAAEVRRKEDDKRKKDIMKRNEGFKLILDENEDILALALSRGKKEVKEKQLRTRHDGDMTEHDHADEEEGNRVIKRSRSRKERLDETEEALQRDIEERDEFDKRLKERDKEKTKKLIEDRSSKGNEEAQKRKLIASSAEREASLEELRVISRQQYLGKREEQRVILLEREIRDEEELFGREKLTRTERQAFAQKKELLRIIKERMQINDKYDGYMMPEDYITEKGKLDKKKQEAALKQRYQETDESFIPEQQIWEDLQVRL
ncbi:mRNA splicing factor RNA helicase [Zopfochytrium polystomum]|nr:mRNA splicing factor RNA helicase [Zopfochytrium polystomum]